MDTGTKSLVVALYNDLYPCIVTPIAVAATSPMIQRKFFQIFNIPQ